MSNIDLTKKDIRKLAVRYLIPSIAGMIGLSMCIFFDTMFIGKGIGDIGLAALNIVIPIFSIFTSIYLLLGVGGATVVSICIGKGRYKDISGIFTMCISIGAVSGIILIILRFLFLDKISILLGATSETFPLVKDYLGIVLIAGIGFIISGILNIFIRNDGNPRLSMWSTIGANITNIVLDYIFIFPLGMGMKGAAYYTSFMPMGLNVVNIAYLQSIERAKHSSLLSILRGIILSITLVLILSNVFGIIGVWLAIPLAELITLIIAFIFINKS